MLRGLFRFAGGFAMAEVYGAAVRPVMEEAVLTLTRQQRDATHETPTAVIVPVPARYAHNTFRGDTDAWIMENQKVAMVCFVVLVCSGGLLAVAGVLTSVAFDGAAGNERYVDVRHRLGWKK